MLLQRGIVAMLEWTKFSPRGCMWPYVAGSQNLVEMILRSHKIAVFRQFSQYFNSNFNKEINILGFQTDSVAKPFL